MIYDMQADRDVHPERYKPGELIRLALWGGHWCLMRCELLDMVGDEPFNRLPIGTMKRELLGLTEGMKRFIDEYPDQLAAEDFSFSKRLNDIGAKIATESTLQVGHVDVERGLVYYPESPPLKANGLEPPSPCDEKDRYKRGKRRDYFADGEDVWKIDLPDRAKENGTLPERQSSPLAHSRYVDNIAKLVKAVSPIVRPGVLPERKRLETIVAIRDLLDSTAAAKTPAETPA
jgi:hypothetical protein